VVLTILKNMKVNGKDDIPYMKWKIKAMFETTNQIITIIINHHYPMIIPLFGQSTPSFHMTRGWD